MALASGDVVVADRDGIVVVSSQRLLAVLARISEIKRLEAKMDVAVKTEQGFPDHIRAIFDSEHLCYVD